MSRAWHRGEGFGQPEPAAGVRLNDPVAGGDREVASPGRAEVFEATLSLDAIARLCDRLGLPAPVPLGGREALQAGGPVPDEAFDVVGGIASRDVVDADHPVPAVADDLATALTLLGAPQILVSVLRQAQTPAMTTSLCVSGDRAAELRPVGGGGHHVALLPASAVLARVTAFCELVSRPVAPVPPLRITAAGLLAATDRIAADDLPGAAAILAGGHGTEESRTAFLRAIVARLAACQVAVLDRRVPGRLRGTVTAWLDGGDAGLWRIPPVDRSASEPTVGLRDPAFLEAEIEVGPVTVAEIVAEITEGFPELLSD